MNQPPERPRLVDPAVHNFLDRALYNSYLYRIKWNTIAFNFFVAVVIIFGVAIFLAHKYKTRPTKYERELRERQKMQKTLETIKRHQMAQMDQRRGIISGQPNWVNEFDAIIAS